jgi:hypothetical protein
VLQLEASPHGNVAGQAKPNPSDAKQLLKPAERHIHLYDDLVLIK